MERRIYARAGALLVAAYLAAAGGFDSDAEAARVRLTTGGATSLTATDNVDLEDEDEQKALITTQSLFANLRADGNRLDLALDYSPNLDLFLTEDDGEDIELRQYLNGLGSAELIEDHLFVDARASMRQALIESTAPVSGNAAVTGRGNTANVTQFAITPYYVQRFGRWAISQLAYTHERIYSSDEGEDDGGNGGGAGDDLETNSVDFTVESGPRFSRLLLSGLAARENVQSDNERNEFKRTTTTASAEYAATRQFHLLGTGGYERFERSIEVDDIEGPVWLAGFRLLGPRSELMLQYGRRFEQPTVEALARWLPSPRLQFVAGYEETVETSETALFDDNFVVEPTTGVIVDPTTGLPVAEDELGFGLDNGVFISERLYANVTGSYRRNTFGLDATVEQRKYEQRGDEDLMRVSGNWRRSLTPITAVSGLVSYQSTERQDGDSDYDTLIGILSYIYQINARWEAVTSYSRSQRFASNSDDEYTENAVTAGLRYSF